MSLLRHPSSPRTRTLAGPHSQLSLDSSRRGVLVVDDDPTVRALLTAVLEREGFRVWLAGDGASAVTTYQQNRPAIDIVLLDVRMPGMDGPGTLAALQTINPAIACCFMSGHTADYSVDELRACGGLHFFDKPFRMDEVGLVLGRIAGGERPDI